MEEKRKSKRIHIPLDVELIPSENTEDYVPGEVRDFSSEGFSFEANNIALGTDKTIEARFKLKSESACINVQGRIVWKIEFGNACQVGVEINKIDTEIDRENLYFPFDHWADKTKKG